MPEDTKRTQQKGPKDQRKPRNRNQAGPVNKKADRNAEESKVPVQKQPVYEEPGPEFYKNLKRETDDILKITEEENSKYKKKEIQSNWSKYEMPIESYDEIEEQESMGADYEKLIAAPLAIGGHFQFKHEKSWDVDTGPSLYDKYFEVDMDNLFLSIATIPFYERLNVDQSIFSETDMLTMNNRATRFKQKYYNDKTFTTPELTAQDNILRGLRENIEDKQEDDGKETIENQEVVLLRDHAIGNIQDINIENMKLDDVHTNQNNPIHKNSIIPQNKILKDADKISRPPNRENTKDLDDFEDLISVHKEEKCQEKDMKQILEPAVKDIQKGAVQQEGSEPTQANPIIESPEDLEKWLDDFLDS